MKLDVTEALANPGQEFGFSGSQAIADQEIGGDTVSFEPCEVSGVLLAGDDGQISVRGILNTTAHARCANCLAPAEVDVETSFDETFQPWGDPEDDEIFLYSGREINLDKLVMSYAVMALPIRFLCREDCPGFEYSDRTEPAGETGIQHPFAGLKQLLEQSEEV